MAFGEKQEASRSLIEKFRAQDGGAMNANGTFCIESAREASKVDAAVDADFE